jgi:predicted nuclease with RNAse H fold
MNEVYLGVDVAGASNTWMCGLSKTEHGLELVLPSKNCSLSQILQYADENNVVAVAIDAQLTSSIDDENGFRSNDMQLREMLPTKYKTWVASQNSMMAVPIRGRQLSEALAPIVGTILETHPGDCLFLIDQNKNDSAVNFYKKPGYDYFLKELLDRWGRRFNINWDAIIFSDGALDSLVCATIAYLYHNDPKSLLRLDHNAANRSGRGPFYVIKPNTSKQA